MAKKDKEKKPDQAPAAAAAPAAEPQASLIDSASMPVAGPSPSPQPEAAAEDVDLAELRAALPFADLAEEDSFLAFRAEMAKAEDKALPGVFKFHDGTFAEVYPNGSVAHPVEVQDFRPGGKDAAQPPVEAAPEPVEDQGVTLDELEKRGYILAKSTDKVIAGATYVDVVTRGGTKLRFPGDEARAAQLTIAQLTGVAPAVPELGTGPGGLQKRTLRDLREMKDPAGNPVIAGEREERDDEGRKTGRTFVTTRGGRSLVFPDDEGKAAKLTDSELDGVARKEWPRVFEKVSLLGKPIAKA